MLLFYYSQTQRDGTRFSYPSTNPTQPSHFVDKESSLGAKRKGALDLNERRNHHHQHYIITTPYAHARTAAAEEEEERAWKRINLTPAFFNAIVIEEGVWADDGWRPCQDKTKWVSRLEERREPFICRRVSLCSGFNQQPLGQKKRNPPVEEIPLVVNQSRRRKTGNNPTYEFNYPSAVSSSSKHCHSLNH